MERELIDVTKKSGVVLTGHIIGNILGFVLSYLAIRMVGTQVYGEFIYVYTLIGFFPIICNLGLDNGLVYFIPKLTHDGKKLERNAIISFTLLVTLLLSIIISLLVLFQSSFIAKVVMNNINLNTLIKILAPLIILLTIFQPFQGIFQGVGNISKFVWVQNILIPVIKIAGFVGLSFFGYKIFGLTIAYYAGLFCGAIVLIRIIWKLKFFTDIHGKNYNIYRNLVSYSWPLLLTNLMMFLTNKTGTLMTGYYLSAEKVAVLNIAVQIGTIGALVLNTFNVMFAPLVSSLYHCGETTKLADIYKVVTKWMLAFNLVIFSIFLLFSHNILQIYGNEFVTGSTVLILVAIGQIINSGVGSVGLIANMTGHPQYNLYTGIFNLILNIILNYLLIPRYGIIGAAISIMVSVSSVNLMRLLLVYRDLKIHPYQWDYLKMILACGISYFIILFCKQWLVINNLFGVGLFSTAFLIIFIVLNLVFGLSPVDTLVLRKIIDKFIPRKKSNEA